MRIFADIGYVPPKNSGPWRLTPRKAGQINGIPNSYGHIIATDGVLCVIETATGFFEGHFAFFVPTKDTKQAKRRQKTKTPNLKSTIEQLLCKF